MRTLLPEELAEYAEAYGITADIAQRDYVAVRVAYAISSDAAVGDAVALKGGFVLRYGYGSARTSKDIDRTIGTHHSALDPKRLQRIVRGQCSDLALTFDPRDPEVGVDSLDFGNLEYTGPLGPGFLTLEMSYREDLLVAPRRLEIDAFGVPPFTVRALAIDEMVAEKWRCLVQRSPRRPGDPYDLWFLWSDFRHRPKTADDIIDDRLSGRPPATRGHRGRPLINGRCDRVREPREAGLASMLPQTVLAVGLVALGVVAWNCPSHRLWRRDGNGRSSPARTEPLWHHAAGRRGIDLFELAGSARRGRREPHEPRRIDHPLVGAHRGHRS